MAGEERVSEPEIRQLLEEAQGALARGQESNDRMRRLLEEWRPGVQPVQVREIRCARHPNAGWLTGSNAAGPHLICDAGDCETAVLLADAPADDGWRGVNTTAMVGSAPLTDTMAQEAQEDRDRAFMFSDELAADIPPAICGAMGYLGPIDAGSAVRLCLAPAGHSGAHCDGAYEWGPGWIRYIGRAQRAP